MTITSNTSGTGHPNRQAVLVGWAHKHMAATGQEAVQFADRVASAYEARVRQEHRALALRTIDPASPAEGYFRVRDANRKIMERWLSGAVHFPAEIEEAWVAALDEPWRGHCLADLAARHGLLAAPLPSEHAGIDVCRVADLLRESGEDLRALGPLLEAGVVTGGDAAQVDEAIRELRETAAVIAGIVNQLESRQAPATAGSVVPLGRKA